MKEKIIYYTGILSCIVIILACFLPWARYNNINETFTGFHVTRFAAGNYYGRAGITITAMSSIILIMMLIPRIWAKRTNLFIAALLFAYCVRTYIIFTASLFDGEVEKKIGIYLIVLCSLTMLIASVFPPTGKMKL